MTRRRRAVTGMIALGLGVGCSDGTTAPLTASDVVGSYALESLNGRLLPYEFPPSDGSTLYSSTFRLDADGAYSTREISGPTGAARRDTASGRGHWELRRRAEDNRQIVSIVYDIPNSPNFPLLVQDGGRTLVTGGYVYRKQ